MGIFNEFFKKEKPVFTGSRFGFGSGGGGATTTDDGGGGAGGSGGPFSVSGGNATTTGSGRKYFYFTSPGSLDVSDPGNSGATMSVDFMLVGEGGQGRTTGGGGGGAGAFIQKMSYALGPFPSSQVSCPVTIGNTNPHPEAAPAAGANSVFTIPVNPKTFTAPGGGGGGPGGNSDPVSGGGGGSRSGSSGGPPGVDPYTSIDGSGNTPDNGIRGAGGDGLATAIYQPPGGVGGGGGGAGGDGADGTNPPLLAGRGGLGRAAFLGDVQVPQDYGTPGPSDGRWFAGGGGGGNHDSPPNAGGLAPLGGGGGRGGNPSPADAGQSNTGGGAGGGGGLANSAPGPVSTSGGGSGILIVRISTSILT